jgi:hypothetical protein
MALEALPNKPLKLTAAAPSPASPPSSRPCSKYHGLAVRYLLPLGFLMRPQLNGATLGGREARGTVNSELDQIIRCPSLETAMRMADTAGASGSPIWSDQAWLTVASCANSRAISDPAWLALCIFAHEKRTVDVAVVDALVKRARLIVEQGPTDTDSVRDPEHFFNGVRRFINGESSPAALESFRLAMNVVFTADRQSSEWGAGATPIHQGSPFERAWSGIAIGRRSRRRRSPRPR